VIEGNEMIDAPWIRVPRFGAWRCRRPGVPLVIAAAAAVALIGGCSTADTSLQATGPTSTGAPTTGAPPSSVDGGDKATSSTKPKGAELGGFVKPQASAAFLTQVAQKTRAANTGRFSLSITVDGASNTDGHVELMELSGAYDKDNDKSSISLDMSGLVEAAPEAAAAEGIDATMFESPIEIVQDGDVQYVKIESLTELLGKPWLKISGAADQSGFGEIFEMFKVEDISGFLATLQAAGEVVEVGTEDLGGVEVIHYHADIDPQLIDTSQDGGAGTLLSSFDGATTAAVDVWVDENGLVRKLSIAADAGALGSDLGPSFPDGTATLTMDLSDFSDVVEIEVPDPDDVLDMDALGALGGLPGPGIDLGLDSSTIVSRPK